MVLNLKAQLLKSMSIESIKLALSEGKKGGGRKHHSIKVAIENLNFSSDMF